MFFPLRDENPTQTQPWVNYGIIAVNVVVFIVMLIEQSAGNFWVTHWYGLVPSRFLKDVDGESFTVLTSMFMHGGWFHLGSNMWFLYVFGDNIEDALGHAKYLAFYFLCGFSAAAAQIAMGPSSIVPMIGASGAIAGVLGAYLILYPRAPIVALNTIPLLWLFMGVIVVVPAWVIALIFFLSNLISAYLVVGSVNNAGVAFFAHLGGFVAGMLVGRQWLRNRAVGMRWS